MKVIVFAHRLEIGGTQVNAIDLATQLRNDHGFEPIIFATPGPAQELIDERGLRFEPAPDARFHPSMRRIVALRSLVRRESADLVHAWDWWQCLEAYYGLHLPSRVPMIVTDMMMDFTRILPRSIPVTFGTPELFDKARQHGYRHARLLVPPVDIRSNAPGAADGTAFRDRLGLQSSDIVLVTVSRLSQNLKAESLGRTIAAVGKIGGELPVRFVIVGSGQARAKLETEAAEVNGNLGRQAIVFAGELPDPRDAYDAADVVIGMGGSALRGAAFQKPVVVVGENGFSNLLSPSTGEWFYYHGMFGHGDGDKGEAHLSAQLIELVTKPEAREESGAYAREFVTNRFSLSHASQLLAGYYRETVHSTDGVRDLTEMIRTTAIYLRERRFLKPSRERISK